MRALQRGLTLLEVMIAVTLLSLVSAGILYTMKTGLKAMEVTSRQAQAHRRAANAQRILNGEIAGFLPATAHCGATRAGDNGGAPVPFFQGQPSVMRFVTTYSVRGAARGIPQVAILFVIPGEDGNGVRLVLNEVPYNGSVGLGFGCLPPPDPELGFDIPRFPRVEASPASFVLADKLEAVRFSYLMRPNGVPEQWVAQWPRRDLWPSAIRIEMIPLEGRLQRVPPMTFTGLIRPNRFPGEPYEF